MSTSLISSLSNVNLQSILSPLQNIGLGNILNAASGSPVSQAPDNGGLSPFAQVVSKLQQLQQTNPTQYQQVTQQIAANLQAAAQTDQSQGNTTGAQQLTQLSSDFSNASTSGQLPNLQDLAQAIGGHHHHGHHSHGAEANSSSSGASTTASNAASSAALSSDPSLTSIFQTNSGTLGTDATSIILNTLSSAGIS
ncbi:MAG TPA: hypothetical protein VKG25_09680 [Bryobacteraceae bacterium]|nr:hypothetical protein [Bryobacteraceae bacterium]